MAPNGRICAYGSAQAPTPEIPFMNLMFKAITVEMALVYILNEEQRSRAVGHLTSLLEAGALNPRIAPSFDLENVASAHEAVENNTRDGAVLVKVG